MYYWLQLLNHFRDKGMSKKQVEATINKTLQRIIKHGIHIKDEQKMEATNILAWYFNKKIDQKLLKASFKPNAQFLLIDAAMNELFL